MKADLRQRSNIHGVNLTLKCPHCGNIGTFETIYDDICCTDNKGKSVVIGIKMCPNPNCGGHAFVIYDLGSRSILDSYPITRLDFNKDDIPTQIAETFEEAIICHANKCYIASAIMVRKTLEQLCKDKGAEGRNLKERIQALIETITMPKELKEGMDVLRVLGNNAAHVELTDFDEISKNELEISIDFTKEILKSVYQFDKLLIALKSLKKK